MEDFENIEEVDYLGSATIREDDVDVTPINYEFEQMQSQSNNFDDVKFIINTIGTDTIYTGVNGDIPRKIEEMTPKERFSALKYYYNSQIEQNSVTEDEREFLDLIRGGQYETLYNQLGQTLGYENQANVDFIPEQLQENDLLMWKIMSDYPDFTQEQVENKLYSMRNSPTYDVELQHIDKQYRQFAEQYNQQLQTESQDSLRREVEGNRQVILEAARDLNDLVGFEVDNNIKNEALRDILEFEDGVSPFVKFIDDPRGMLTAAVALKIIPRIADYVETLQQELEQLKSQRKTYYRPQDDWSSW